MIQGRYNLLGYSVQLKWLCEDVHSCPRKIRELIRDLEKAGFVNRGGKGSHRNYEHPSGLRTTISGKAGDDAKRYQEREVKKDYRGIQIVNDSARYIKIVEWSDEDQCFIGECPGVIGQCCHGDNEAEVYSKLCGIVEEWLEILKQEGKPLPPPTAGQNIAAKIAS